MQRSALNSKNQITIEINDIVKMVSDKRNPVLNHCTLKLGLGSSFSNTPISSSFSLVLWIPTRKILREDWIKGLKA